MSLKNPQDVFERRRKMGTSTLSLSSVLKELGFFRATNTTQTCDGESSPVVTGEPLRCDCNNGVAVVYDENGDPWITRSRRLKNSEMEQLVREFGLARGAYVPHSNDGGHFIRQIMPDSILMKVTDDLCSLIPVCWVADPVNPTFSSAMVGRIAGESEPTVELITKKISEQFGNGEKVVFYLDPTHGGDWAVSELDDHPTNGLLNPRGMVVVFTRNC